MGNAYIVGIATTRFGRFADRSVESLAADAIFDALKDAGVEWRDIQQLYAAHVSQGVAAGQRVIKEVGPSGIPVVNVENCSAASSTALREAALAVSAGAYDLVMVSGFEKMNHGLLLNVIPEDDPDVAMGLTVLPMRFSLMGMQHMQDYGTRPEHFAAISVKNHQHAVHNPKAQYPKEVSLEQVMQSRMICDPITVLQCSPTTDGAAAAVVCSEAWLQRNARSRAVRILGSALTSDCLEYSQNRFTLDHVQRAANQVYEKTGIGPGELDVVETHDCFSVAELVAYEALGLCAPGEGGRLVDERETWIGGRIPVNPSGGLLAKGHPLGATGLGQIAELVGQLRGEAGQRQVQGARLALASNMGMWSSCVTMLEAQSI